MCDDLYEFWNNGLGHEVIEDRPLSQPVGFIHFPNPDQKHLVILVSNEDLSEGWAKRFLRRILR